MRRLAGSHRMGCTQLQDMDTILRSFDMECNYMESTGIGDSYTDSIGTAGIHHTGIESSYTDNIDTVSIHHTHIDT